MSTRSAMESKNHIVKSTNRKLFQIQNAHILLSLIETKELSQFWKLSKATEQAKLYQFAVHILAWCETRNKMDQFLPNWHSRLTYIKTCKWRKHQAQFSGPGFAYQQAGPYAWNMIYVVIMNSIDNLMISSTQDGMAQNWYFLRDTLRI